MTLNAGRKLGRYEIRKQIGAGGMGEVYLAEDTRLRRKIALKVLPENIAQDKDRLRRFEQEAHSASALNHPNILTIYEFGAEKDVHFLAAEFVEGETLRERMLEEPLSIEEALDVAAQTVSALAAAHASGIIHRDIKPENIMIRRDHLVKVLDFGLAKLTENKSEISDAKAETWAQVNTMPGVIMGTAAYMSPEQARGKQTGARSDIWSVGCVLYEMLTRKHPFVGETMNDTIAAILMEEPASPTNFNREITAKLERIVLKTLTKDVEERYQTAEDLLVDLKSLKKQIEFRTEFEQTASASTQTTGLNKKATQILPVQATSSAKYIVGEIKNHKTGFVVFSVLLFAAIGLGYWFFANRPATATPIESIAVLLFANESGNADTEYLSEGMTESLISSLSQLPKLSVKARSSVFRYKGKETNAQTIGKELNVQAILNGRVVQRGNDLTLYVELIDTTTENVLWKESYNKPMANLIALQSEIARDVSNKLKTKLSGADEQRLAKNYTENTEAYQLYLKGRFYWNKRTGKDLQKAIEYFQQAIDVDPNYALAYAGLADAYALLSPYLAAPPREVMPKAREAAQKALTLDDQLVEAHTALGLILNTYDYDFAGAEREFKRAIELNPNYATAHQFYGELLMYLDRREDADAEFRRAVELDPLSLIINRQYGESLLYARKYEASIVQFKKTLDLDSNFAAARVSLSVAYQLTGKHPETIEEYAKFQELIGEKQNAALIRQSFAEGGWSGFLRTMIGETRLSNATPYTLATWYTMLGKKDKAFEELNKSYEIREYFLVLLKVDPRFDDLRSDQRFQDLLRRVGFPQLEK